jgi:hypothetical protein
LLHRLSCSYVVGIRNKRTGQLRLSEAAGSIMLRLEAQAAHVADADVAGVIKAAQQQQGQQGQLPQDMAARRLMARRWGQRGFVLFCLRVVYNICWWDPFQLQVFVVIDMMV